MKKESVFKRFILIIVAFFFVDFVTIAQDKKLPQIQQNSIWMENFEADGKLDEWAEPLEAYNTDTHIAYSLANDEDYLYLAVKSSKTTKIRDGGMVFEIYQDTDSVRAITFPYNFTYDRKVDPNLASHPDRPRRFTEFTDIEVKGIPVVTVATIPLVNEFGIQAVVTEVSEYDEHMDKDRKYCVIELAIPLQYLKTVSSSSDFSYRIVLRGVVLHPDTSLPLRPSGLATYDPGSGRAFQVSERVVNEMYEELLDLHRVSDLHGTYRLAPKPE